MFSRVLSLFTALALTASTASANDAKLPSDEEVKAAHLRLTAYLKRIEGAEAGQVNPLSGDGLASTFPDHILFSVMFPQFPVARLAPAPLSSANVVAVPKKKDGKPVVVTNGNELEKFFKENARAVKTADEAAEAIKAFLRASAELAQDGFYKFTVKTDDKPKVDGSTVTGSGQAVVEQEIGNKGEIKATLTFKDGKLTEADTKPNVIRGNRPRVAGDMGPGSGSGGE